MASRRIDEPRKKFDAIINANWELFSWTPAEEDLLRAVFWEYARDFKEVSSRIVKLRDLAASYFRLDEKTESAIAAFTILNKKNPVKGGSDYGHATLKKPKREGKFFSEFEKIQGEINYFAGRFDWHFLCAADFPEKRWRYVNKNCPIARLGNVFRTPRSSIVSNETRKIKHGRKIREKASKNSLFIPVYDVELESAFRGNDYGALNLFTDEILSDMKSEVSASDPRIYFFAIPEAFFSDYDPEFIAAALRQECHKLGKRRLVLNFTNSSSRSNLRAFYRWLGMRRFLHSDESQGEKKTEIKNILQLARSHTDRSLVAVAYKILRVIESKSLKATAEKADRVFFEIFKEPESERPKVEIKRFPKKS